MNWWNKENFEQKKPYLLARNKAYRAVRSFFESRDYVEVHTPALQICPVMDAHIHAFKTVRFDVARSQTQTLYLHTSPEFDMKKLLAAGMERIYQICPVYRNAEGSNRHSAEFTLLEWYQVYQDYRYMMRESVELIRFIAQELNAQRLVYNDTACDPYKEARALSVAQAFQDYTAIDLNHVLEDRDGFAQAAHEIGVRVIDTDYWDDIFHAIMAEKIEPFLGSDVITILYDYPVSMAALSRAKVSDPRYAERFEIYICGVEIANAFSELTDPVVQQERFEAEMALKEVLYGERYPRDDAFFEALSYVHESAGIALGLERLVMLCTGAQEITQVQWCSLAPIHSS